MKRSCSTLILCIVFNIQGSFAQKLEKVYESSLRTGFMQKPAINLNGIYYVPDINIKHLDDGFVIEFEEKRSDSLIVDYIHCDGRKVLNKRIHNPRKSGWIGGQGGYISDSSRLILVNYNDGLFNIFIYDIHTGTLIQNIKTTVKVGDLFKKSGDKIRTRDKRSYFKNKNHAISGGSISGNMLLLNIRSSYPAANTPLWIDLSNPENMTLVFPEFPQLNDDEHKLKDQIWDYEKYDSGIFIYTRRYFLDKGPKKGNACTIAEFDKDGKLIRSIDVNLETADYNTFHIFQHYVKAAEVKYDKTEKVFYVVSSVKSDKIINGNTYALILKKFDLAGKIIWEKIYFDAEIFAEYGGDATLFKYPMMILNPMNQTFKVGVCLSALTRKIEGFTFSSINAALIDKQLTPYAGFVTKYTDPKLEKQIKEEMEFNKYNENIPIFFENDKASLVLFKDASGGYAAYSYR